RARTLGARLSNETDLDAGIQAIEVGRAAAVEEVVITVFGGDEPESTLGDELLDGSRHLYGPPFPNVLPRAVEACSSGAHGERSRTRGPAGRLAAAVPGGSVGRRRLPGVPRAAGLVWGARATG